MSERPAIKSRPYANITRPVRFPGRARQAMSPERANTAPVISCSHCSVVNGRLLSRGHANPTERPRPRKRPLRGGQRGGGDGLVAVRVDREVLLEVRKLEQAADRPRRGDDEQALARARELVGGADDDAE